MIPKRVPGLRFNNFSQDWEMKQNKDLLKRIVDPVTVVSDHMYEQIGIRSHGKGVFHKDRVSGKELGNKRVFWLKENLFIVNIVFAWEQAIAITSSAEKGLIASHRFPMYKSIEGQSYEPYLLHFFLTRKGKRLLELASPGGAGRNKTLGQKEFEKLRYRVPNIEEQTRIANFLTAVDKHITLLQKKKEALEQYKKGVMQKLFSKELRFTDDQGNDFPNWEEKKLGEIATICKGKGISKADVELDGKTECIRYGELYTKYKEVISTIHSRTNLRPEDLELSKINDIIIPSSGETAIDIATASCVMKDGIALGGDINIIRTEEDGVFLSYYLNNDKRNDIARLAQGISVIHLYGKQLKDLKISVPSRKEQKRITTFLSTLDQSIEKLNTQIKSTKTWRKGLLQRMFV